MRKSLAMSAVGLFLVSAAPGQEHPRTERGFDPEKVYQFGEIDHVDLAGLSLQVTLPIGQRYQVSDRLSYGLTLVNSSKAWDYVPGGQSQTRRAVPNRFSNAGQSWRLTMGDLLAPQDLLNPTRNRTNAYVYLAPDGGFHEFWNTQHPEDTVVANVFATRDNSYLRLKLPPLVPVPTIEFGDGTVHKFEPVPGSTTAFRLKTIQDRFGTDANPANWVQVDYENPDPNTQRWRIRDARLREHVVHFGKKHYDTPGATVWMIDRVEMSAFDDPADPNDGNGKATYDFAYFNEAGEPQPDPSTMPYRDCADNDGTSPEQFLVARLSSLYLPDNTTLTLDDNLRWRFNYFNDQAESGEPSCRRGQIEMVKYPTGGAIRYDYRNVYFPGEEPCPAFDFVDSKSIGIVERIIDVDGVKDPGDPRWFYHSELEDYSGPTTSEFPCEDNVPGGPVFPIEQQTVFVTTALGDQTEHYFSVWSDLQPSLPHGFRRVDFGLPFTRMVPAQSDGTLLSTRTYECDNAGGCVADRFLVREEFVLYETDTLHTPAPIHMPTAVQSNRREKVRKVITYERQEGIPEPAPLQFFKRFTNADFDGLGHFRETTTAGDYPGTNVRKTYTRFNDARGTYPPPGTYSQFPAGSPWILGTHTFSRLSEDQDGNGTATGQEISRKEFIFDSTTGFLNCARTLKGTTGNGEARTQNDLLAVFTPDSFGNVSLERYFGGDRTPIGTVGSCSDGSTAEYTIDHVVTYQAQATDPPPTRTSEYLNVAMAFKTTNLTFDPKTGLPTLSKDSAAVPTSFKYDPMGRVKEIRPGTITSVDAEAWTQIAYNATPPLWVEWKRCDPASASDCTSQNRYTTESVEYDGLGRVRFERKRLPGGGPQDTNLRYSEFDAMGHRTRQSSWVSGNPMPNPSTIAATRHSDFDVFGRPAKTILPDGYEVTFEYEGDRWVGTRHQIGLGLGGGVLPVVRWEQFDLHGRLFRVEEFSKPDQDDDAATQYFYEENGKLRRVCQDVSGQACGQERLFTYDNRGFLTSERHPEKGDANGNDPVAYSQIDSRGHAWQKQDGGAARTIKFEFDKAERLKLVEDAAGNDLKRFVFDTASGAALGKVHEAIRINDIDGTGSEVVEVKEIYEYKGIGGRPSKRQTKVAAGLPSALSTTDCWELQAAYHPLGAVASVTYPQHAFGATCGINVTTPLKTQSFTYAEGLLRTIPGWTAASDLIEYHPNLMINEIPHANGSMVTIANDPNRMTRPASISATYPDSSDNWTTGTHTYDGAGNITRMTNGATVDRFMYDKVSRLREANLQSLDPSPDRTQVYRFDVYGNLDRITTDGTGVDFLVTAGTNRLSLGTYDLAGNLDLWQGNDYVFDLLNTMSGLNIPSQGQSWSYVYTADDERLIAINPVEDTQTWTLRDFGNRLLRREELVQISILGGRTDGAAKGEAQFACTPPAGHQIVFCDGFESGNTAAWTLGSGEVGQEVTDYIWRGAQLLGSRTWQGLLEIQSHFALDHLGTVRTISSDVGNVVAKHTYFGFGQEATSAAADGERMKFTGHERDLQATPSGTADDLDYMHARYCNPLAGRFVSTDPAQVSQNVSRPQSWNRYAYAAGNPARLVDKNGLWEQDFHYGMTRLAAFIGGADDSVAHDIALATLAVDKAPSTSPVTLDINTREAYHFPSDLRLAQLKGYAMTSPMQDLGDGRSQLGTYLHALQDSFSHQFDNQRFENSHYPGPPGAFDAKAGFTLFGRDFDNTSTRPLVAMSAFIATVDAVSQALGTSARLEPAQYQAQLFDALRASADSFERREIVRRIRDLARTE